MDAHEVLVRVVPNVLARGTHKPSRSADVDLHCVLLPLYLARGDVVLVGISKDSLLGRALTLRRAVLGVGCGPLLHRDGHAVLARVPANRH